jgi:hypothetical protein
MLCAAIITVVIVIVLRSAESDIGKVPAAVHIRFSEQSFNRVKDILTQGPRERQEIQDDLASQPASLESPFSIDASVDMADAEQVVKMLRSAETVELAPSTCSSKVASCNDNTVRRLAASLTLPTLRADALEEDEDEFTVAGTVSKALIETVIGDHARRLGINVSGALPTDAENLHYEVNCDNEDPEALSTDGCDIELFNLPRGTDDNSSGADPRRLCGRRRRRRRRREDRRRRRNIFRAPR